MTFLKESTRKYRKIQIYLRLSWHVSSKMSHSTLMGNNKQACLAIPQYSELNLTSIILPTKDPSVSETTFPSSSWNTIFCTMSITTTLQLRSLSTSDRNSYPHFRAILLRWAWACFRTARTSACNSEQYAF